ncbi:ZIP family metal transporter [Bacillota bacterium LX-D]|nr:ZIP family metal transporter [Bacillota bacterium LX-D]
MFDTLLLSVLAGLATLVGALIIAAFGKPSAKTLAVFFGLAAGMMFSVVTTDLIPSSLEYGSLKTLLLGFVFGIVLLKILNKILVYLNRKNKNSTNSYLRRMGYLISIGIALHDLPEGIAIAAGFSADTKLGWLLSIAIGLHNIPEGMVTAAPLYMSGLSVRRILSIVGLVSIFTPIGTLIGLIIVSISPLYISFLLAMAAGAMSYIVFWEIVPESRKHHPNYAFCGMILGFVVILLLGVLE